ESERCWFGDHASCGKALHQWFWTEMNPPRAAERVPPGVPGRTIILAGQERYVRGQAPPDSRLAVAVLQCGHFPGPSCCDDEDGNDVINGPGDRASPPARTARTGIDPQATAGRIGRSFQTDV